MPMCFNSDAIRNNIEIESTSHLVTRCSVVRPIVNLSHSHMKKYITHQESFDNYEIRQTAQYGIIYL